MIMHKYIALIVLFILTIFKFLLLGKGALAFPDEQSYFESIHVWYNFTEGNFSDFCRHIIGSQLSSGHNIVRLPSVIIQNFLFVYFNFPFLSSNALLVPQVQNIVISFIQLYLFYKICKKIFISEKLQISLCIIFSLLINTNLYIRHILSYDSSLTVFLLCFLYLLQLYEKDTLNKSFFIGVLSAIGFVLYYGNYLFPAILFFAILILSILKNNIKLVISYAIGTVSIFTIFEIIAWLGGISFLKGNLMAVEGVYENGTPKESYIFIFKYLYELEGIFGVLLLTSFMISSVFGIKKILKKDFELIYLIYTLILLAYVVHATISFVWEDKVFFGRNLKLFYPFIVLSFGTLLNKITLFKKHINSILITTISITCLNFFLFLKDYINLGYPRDILAAQKIHINLIPEIKITSETPPYFIFGTSKMFNKEFCFVKNDNITRLVNFSYLHGNLNTYIEYTPTLNEELFLEVPHFQSYTPYMFEEKKINERLIMKKRDYKIKIYKII